MEDVQAGRLIMASIAGIAVTIGFDAILHGLSHGGHGILDSLWRSEKSQRKTGTRIFSGIAWHLTSDLFMGIVLALLVVLAGADELNEWIALGLLAGCLNMAAWLHSYAAFEIGGKLIFTLGSLAIIQSTLASVAIGWVYVLAMT
jgi:hypothetical protein